MTEAAKSLRWICGAFRQDLEAVPEEMFLRSLGGKARTVSDITYEVTLVNEDICRHLKGEPISEWPEGWLKAPPEWSTKVAVLTGYDKSCEQVLAFADSVEPSTLPHPVETEHGTTTVEERLRFMTLHMWYHAGQLNYIQSLLGDEAWHWK